MVEELLSYTSADVEDLDHLMHELSPTSFCNEEILDAVLRDVNSRAYVIREDGHIVAAGSLCVMHNLEFTIASVESVVVASSYRGRGYGRMLMTHIIEEAKMLKVRSINLTSNPKRVAANNLYQSLGFVRYETNCYHFEIQKYEYEAILK